MPLIFTQLGYEGIDGIMYVAPISDFLAAVLSLIVIKKVFKKLN